jgi:prenyltransferase beta subunit
MRQTILCFILVCAILCTSQISLVAAPIESPSENQPDIQDGHQIAADSGIPCPSSQYIVLEMTSGDIPQRGSAWSQLLDSRGIPNILLQTTDVIVDPSLITAAPAIILDGSLGSSNGSMLSQSVVDALVKEDISLILVGRSAWLLHRLSGRGPPSLTAPIETTLYTQPEYSGAVFLNYPNSLSIGSSLTSEVSLVLPIDESQTEMSRLVNLTGSSISSRIASARYDSYPLDVFLFAPENPTSLTATGIALLENIIAFSTAIRESTTATALSELQSGEAALLAGGMSYMHEPLLSSAYYAVHIVNSILSGSDWTNWVSANAPLIRDLLNGLVVDYGSESGFMSSQTDALVDLRNTAQGLWLIAAMGLSAEFSVSEIVAYLSSRQNPDGGFDNYITTTYHVTEALWTVGQLTSIDTYQLELWLRSLVIDGSKTSNPDLWGAIGSNPTSVSPLNNYAIEYLRSLSYLGKAHPDPSKLTSWILGRTSNGDGSFRNSIGLDEELVTGTASALASMQMLGTLSAQNKTLGINWLTNNQLDSGGFGLKASALDLVSKTRESSRVANCLKTIGETSGSLSDGLIYYVDSIKSDVGFEAMDILPSLMWTSWLLETSRLTHASQSIDLALARNYISDFNKLTIYPFWSNLTTATSPEYSINQYRTKSVWTQYFGVTAAQAAGVDLNDNVISDVVLYLSQSQYMTGHYRPTSLTGTAHMQFSVAAVETLYILNELDSIPYRANLENAILSEYTSGSWSSSGWSLKPFADSQEAIDFLSTRAAIRLGIITPAMAAEIAAAIHARLQYTDLVALSWDVATLTLLNISSYFVDLESVNTSLVLSALRSSHFTDGWFDSIKLWQPIYTSSVLKMVSILGLRCLLHDIQGLSLDVNTDAAAQLGTVLNISVTISSLSGSHSVLVNAFDESFLFHNVANTDVLHLPISTDRANLGLWNVTLMVMDWGSSRAFDLFEISIEGTLEGTVQIFNPLVKMGEFVNGTLHWSLLGGIDAGIAHVTLRLGEPPMYHQWNYNTLSPFSFSLPTTDFDAGIYSLTATIEIPNCLPLILNDEAMISEPDPTYMQTTANTNGVVGDELGINWSLRFLENNSLIGNQLVTLFIRDTTDTIVFSDNLISSSSGNTFLWTPSSRGDFLFSLNFNGNGTLDSSQIERAIHVYETTEVSWSASNTTDQYSPTNLSVFLATARGEVIVGKNVHIIVTAPSLMTVVDNWFVTNATGRISIGFLLSENGVYLFQAQFLPSEFLLGSTTSQSIISWSSSDLELGGVGDAVPIGNTYRLWAQLEDLVSNPVSDQSVLLRVVALPSAVLVEQMLITNSSGYVSMKWVASVAGTYRFEAVYNGTISRDIAAQTHDFDVLIPVSLTVNVDSSSEVGTDEWIEVTTRNHLGEPISGISITITVRGPGNSILYTNTSSTIAGSVIFHWIPSQRGINEVNATASRQGLYSEATLTASVDVFETPSLTIESQVDAIAPTTDTVLITLADHETLPIQGASIYVNIMLGTSILIDEIYSTDSTGQISIVLNLNAPGVLQINITLPSQGWFLGSSANSTGIVAAATALTIMTPGQPVEQGSTVGILVTLRDYADAPLIGATIQIEVVWSNGTVLRTVSWITDGTGHCTLAQTFIFVGDFIIRASYAGFGLNASATSAIPQRVFVNPSIHVSHDPSCITGEAMEFHINLTDALGNFIIGRIIELRIEQDGSTVFEVQILSANGPSTITWYPNQGGLATVTVAHLGNIYFLTASTVSTASVLELVSGNLSVSPTQIDLFDSTTLVYVLESILPRPGVTIHFEVLGMDLVPVWIADVPTNASGIASIIYMATETSGVLHVNAGPVVDEFLIGGDVQEQLVVMTFCHSMVSLQPTPAAVNKLTNITIYVVDDLGDAINGPAVTVSLYDPYGEIVKLGAWTNPITVPIVDGLAVVDFIPTMVGLYTVTLSASGSVSVHGFTSTTHHTIYSVTQLELTLSTDELEVGQRLDMVVQLLDHHSVPLVGRNIVLYLDGPGSSSFGPVSLVTNATGHVSWSAVINDEGFWTLDVSFSGLGVYLPASADEDINVRYGTAIELSLETLGDIIAGQTNTSYSILLTDTGGTPLEGFTVHYEVYHETLGLVIQGSLIQTNTDPMILNLMIERMGNYTIIVSFSGTSHYHSSNAGLQFLVLGTTHTVATIPEEIDRSSEDVIQIFIVDELSSPILLSELNIAITLQESTGLVDLSSRLMWNDSGVAVYTHGLHIGQYLLNLTVFPTNMRLGGVFRFGITITSITHLEIVEEDLPGLISEQHSLLFVLSDSLKEAIDNADVWASLYDPLGREIYGHPLSTKTLLHSSPEGTEVSWTPILVGDYRLVLVFEGDDFLNASSLELIVLVLHESSFTLNGPSQSEYGEIVPVSVTLEGALGGISGASVMLRILNDGVIEQEMFLTTGSRGIVSTNLVGLIAGTHVIMVTFAGSATQASCSSSITLDITPVVIISLDTVNSLYVGQNCSLDLSVSVLGPPPGWNGTLTAVLYNPSGSLLRTWIFDIGPYSILHIDFMSLNEGTHSLNVTITDLPVTIERMFPMVIVVVRESLSLQLDASTTPMFGGLGLLAIIGLVMRKKMKSIISTMPNEWVD